MCHRGRHFFVKRGFILNITKKFATFNEQLEFIENKGFKISDREECLNFLKRVNYYDISAYFLPFRNSDRTIQKGIEFKRIYKIYEFDKKIRSLIFSVIEEIELYLRTQLAYYHAEKYGALGYKNKENFSEFHDHQEFLTRIKYECIKRNNKNAVIVHHNEKYNGQIPIWVLVSFFSIGTLSRFYGNMKTSDKKAIAKNLYEAKLKLLESWLKCLTVLRNKCAHYSRLYFLKFSNYPRLPKNSNLETNSRLFGQLLVLKFLHINDNSWNNNFLISLESLLEEYSEYIRFMDIGFPDNWKEILSK